MGSKVSRNVRCALSTYSLIVSLISIPLLKNLLNRRCRQLEKSRTFYFVRGGCLVRSRTNGCAEPDDRALFFSCRCFEETGKRGNRRGPSTTIHSFIHDGLMIHVTHSTGAAEQVNSGEPPECASSFSEHLGDLCTESGAAS